MHCVHGVRLLSYQCNKLEAIKEAGHETPIGLCT
jgi:hypothetical protein